MKKISKIMGVGLALILVLSLAFALVPAKAEADEGNMQWVQQPLPSAAYNVLVYGSNVVEFAIASDGVTIYAINNGQADTTPLLMTEVGNAANNFQLYKSVDAGQTWVGIPTNAIAGAVAAVLGNVAVSPTNADVVAISSFDAAAGIQDLVYVSNSGGIAWAPLPAPAAPGVAANARVMDLKVGPDRADAILQREYLIAVADDAAAPSVVNGGLQIIGAAEAWGATGTAWADLTDAFTPVDFLACEFSPQYLGARTVVGVGAAPAAVGIAPLGTSVYVFNTQADTLLNAAGTGDLLNAASTEFVAALPANDALAADIALSPDFDFATPGYDKVYASITYNSTTNTGGVYRTEQGLPVANILVGQAINSISYAGDAWGGTLFAADYNALAAPAVLTRVRYTTQPVINAPTWYPSRKSPTGNTGFGFVRVSPTFLTDQTVYSGTTSAVAQESAFSISTDAGVSFNQESLIDLDASNSTVAVDAFALTPDGTTIYVLTNDDDGAGVADQFSLWKSPTGPAPFTWMRVFCATHAATSIGRLAINRAEWADNPEIYVAETPTLALTFYVSSDAGNLWANRTAPVIPGANIAMIWAEKQLVAYVGIGANVFKTVSGGAGAWGPPVPTFVPAIVSVVALPGSDGNSHVLVGGTTGASSISINGGDSFALLPPGLNAAGSYIVIPDGEYPVAGAEGENLLYAGDIAAANGLYRLKVGTDTLWESMANPTAATESLAGLGMSNGTLYGMTQGGADNTVPADATLEAECDRTLVPHFAVGDMVWGTMNVPVNTPTAIGIGLFDVAQNKAYAVDNATNLGGGTFTPPSLWAYNDYYATSNTVVNTPAAGATIPVDPVTGRANLLPVTWDAVGAGTGLATNYLFAIFEASQGFPGAVTVACGNMPLPSAPSNAIYPWAIVANPPDINYTFVAGTTYGIMIAALNQVSGDVIMSQWSDALIFDVEAASGIIQPPHSGPLLNEPTLDATSTGVDVGLSWAPMSGVTEYELLISTNSDLSAPVISEVLGTTSYGATLDFDTVYYYGVRATAPTSSVQTTGTFTMAEPVEKYTCEYCGLTFDTRAELEAHIAAAHAPATPLYIWIVIVIGAILVIAVIWLIFTTRRT